MRVKVSKAFISKTFMSGLKVSSKKQQQQQQRQLNKSNNKSLEFYLQLVKIFKIIVEKPQQLLALTILKEFATFANNLLQLANNSITKTTTTIPLLILVQQIFISFNVFSRLTVLMNDFRLKTFYCKSSKTNKNKFNKNKIFIKNNTTTTSSTLPNKKQFNSRHPLTNSLLNRKISSTLSSSTSSSTAGGGAVAASAVAFAPTATLLLQQNNNHHRTYNNSSKSNKVFLYYTPRDPRLRIFLKTKHLFKRPQEQQQQKFPLINTSEIIYLNNNNNKNKSCCLNSVKKLLSDLCNYGELIGGSLDHCGEYKNININNISENHKTIVKQLNSVVNYKLNKPTKEICDNLNSDNLIIVATAGAAIVTISANILFVILSVAVLVECTQELLRTIEILLSFHTNRQQQLNILYVKSTFGLHDSIL